MRADPVAVLAPVYAAFPAAKSAIDSCLSAIRLAYPPIPVVTDVRIYNSATGKLIVKLVDGMTLKQADVPAGATIVADVSATPCTLSFTWDGMFVRTESGAPYCISSDRGPGRYNPWDGLTAGEHTLVITPFDRPGGDSGNPTTLRLTILANPDSGGGGSGGDSTSDWSVLPLAPGAREIFVRSDGDDSNAGFSADQPVRSLAKALSLLRPTGGDRFRLFAGHTFAGGLGSWRASGLPGMPAGVFAYGDSPARPILAVTQGSGILFDTDGLHDIALVGVRITAADRDPALGSFDANSKAKCGVEATRAVANLLFEDCQVDHFPYNFNFVVWMNRARHTGVVLRRCLLLDAWALPADAFKGQGLYAESVDDLRITQCVLDHNGWVDGAPGIAKRFIQFRHGVYASAVNMGLVTFEGNLCSSNANCGTQQRSGGVVRGNLFLDNGVSALLSGEDATFENNLVVDGHDTIEYGLGIAVSLSSRTGQATRNVMIDACAGYGPYPAARLNIDRRDWTVAGPRKIEIVGNAIAGCAGPAFRNGDRLASLIFADNDLQGVRQEIVALDRPADAIVAKGNGYESAAGNPIFTVGVGVNAARLALAEWAARTGDTSVVKPANFANPSWRPPTDLVARARSRPRGVWGDQWDVTSVIAEAQQAFLRRGS